MCINLRSYVLTVYYPRRRRGRRTVFICVRLPVSPHDISKTSAIRIAQLGTEMFNNESWKPIYFEVEVVKGEGREP